MFPKCVFKYVSNCITIVWEGLVSQQAAKSGRQNGRREERKGFWGCGNGMTEWSKSQNGQNLRDHCIQLTMSEELSWTVTSWQTSESNNNPWLFLSILYKNVLQMFLYSRTPTWNYSWLKHEILPFTEILAVTTWFCFSLSTISSYSEYIT